mgnify:CR=1 FL=1
MNMGDRIRICLKQQNMNMKDLSEKADIPLSTLSDLMNGKTKKLDVQKAKDISAILKCSLDYLINEDLMDNYDISTELKEAREVYEYSIEDLSEKTKIPVNFLKEFENSEPINFFLLKKICDAYGISVSKFYADSELYDLYIPSEFEGDVDSYEAFMKSKDEDAAKENQKNLTQGVKVPVLGRVVAGIPLEAVTEILDYEELHPNVAKTGEFFALQIKGNSMSPRICDGDVVIVKRQNTVDSGDIAIVLINGDEATVKKVKLDENGIMLIAFNADVYEPHFYSNEEIKTLPIEILGKVVELRGKF